MTIDAGVGVNKMKAGYHVYAEFMGVEIGASAKVTIDGADISLKAKADLANGDLGLKITDFDIDKLGHISVDISGLGPLDWILGTVVGAIADTIKGFIIPLIEGPIKDILQNIINGMMPPTAAILMQ